MADNFSWQTEDETEWQEPLPPPPHFPRRRIWLCGILVVILAAALVYNRLQQQVETATTQAREAVLAVHEISQYAAANQDIDLFRSNLSRRDPVWANVQRELVSQGLFLDRSAFGLEWLSEPTHPLNVTFSPDLLTAEVTYEQTYQLTDTVPIATTLLQTVRLQHIAIYRHNGERWLRADPLDEFWGERDVVNHEYLTLQYEARDADLAPQLATDLNTQLQQMCQTFPSLNCEELHLTLHFTRNPDFFFSLLELKFILKTEETEGVLHLPSPTLVGLPVDEAGYDMLLRGYAVPLVSWALVHLTGYECCDHAPFFRAFLDKELSLLDLTTWPLTTEIYEQLAPTDLPGPVMGVWNSESFVYDANTRFYLYSLVDFLTEVLRPQLDITLWQNNLRPQLDYWDWLLLRLGTEMSFNLFNTQWMGYIQQKNQPVTVTLPPLPAGHIQMSCMSRDRSSLIRYSPSDNTWSEVFSGFSSSTFAIVPGGYVTQELNENGHILVLYPGDRRMVIASSDTSASSYFPNYPYVRTVDDSPAAAYLHFFHYRNQSVNSIPQHWLADLNSCETGECEVRPLPGAPLWSPDGQHMILHQYRFIPGIEHELYLADTGGEAQQKIAAGVTPFWFDNQQYGFFTQNEEHSEMYIGDTMGGSPHRVLVHTDLPGFLDDTPENDELALAVADPEQGGELLLVAFQNNNDQTRYFLYRLILDNLRRAVLTMELLSVTNNFVIPTYSPDGLFVLLMEGEERDLTLSLIERATGSTQTVHLVGRDYFNPPLWSENGTWLMTVTNHEIVFIAPHQAYERRIPHAFPQCNDSFYVAP